MPSRPAEPQTRLRRSLEAGRVHSAYLFSGPGEAPRETALWFARALACEGPPAEAPCEHCVACRRSTPGEEPIPLDGTGKKGPLLRHVGDHPDLLWVERGADDTRVRIGQVRALQGALRLRGSEGGRRAAVVADAEWLNQEAQNALLRLLEEPPPETSLLLVTRSPAGLLATVRSRCQRVALPPDRTALELGEEAPAAVREAVERLDALGRTAIPDLLDQAEAFRGPRAIAAAAAGEWLSVASAWLHRRTRDAALAGDDDPEPRLRAWAALQHGRRALAQRNANPQMVVERALLALREAETAR
jgi:DNA polymerase-3 subunit delta'